MPTIELRIPALHEAQRRTDSEAGRFNVWTCGRRFGKSVLSRRRLLRTSARSLPAAYFAPTYKMLADYWRETVAEWFPIIEKMNVQEKRLQLRGGGSIDMWSLDEPNAARGRKYAHIAIDEAASVARLEEAWQEVLRPTLSDLRGTADFYSTPRGQDFFWRLWQRGQDSEFPEWQSWQIPTSANPYISKAEIESARIELPQRVFEQEYLAIFQESSGGVFRKVAESVDKARTENEAYNANRRYAMGVDLARVNDFTVISVVDETGRQVYFERFNQISWERQIESIKRVAEQYKAQVVMDSTGVGDPVYEQVRKLGVRVTPFQFTNSSKEQLIDNLAMRIEQGEARLMDVPVQTSELQAYQYELTPSRNVRMNAPSGLHDDAVIALALAMWGINKRTELIGAFA
jgi:hypothetical protein